MGAGTRCHWTERRIRVKVIGREQLHGASPARERREIAERLVQPDMGREAEAELRGDINQRGMHAAQGFGPQFVPELVVVAKVSGVDGDAGGL